MLQQYMRGLVAWVLVQCEVKSELTRSEHPHQTACTSQSAFQEWLFCLG